MMKKTPNKNDKKIAPKSKAGEKAATENGFTVVVEKTFDHNFGVVKRFVIDEVIDARATRHPVSCPFYWST